MPPPRHLPARIRSLGGRDSPESADLARARTLLESRERRLEESFLALDAYSWRLDRFRDGDNWLGGYGSAGAGWGYPADRTQDRTHAPVPYETEVEWRLHVAASRDIVQRNHLALAARDLVCDFIGTVTVSFVERGEEPGATGDAAKSPLVREVNTAWKEFCELMEWGEGEEDCQRECLQRTVVEGETTARFFEGDSHTSGLPHVRIIDPEFIRTPTGASLTDPWGWGVKTRARDASGPEEGICVADPEEPTRMHAVESSEYVRTKINVDRVIKRGVSDFFPCSGLFDKVLDIRESLAHNANLLAKLLWWEQFPTATKEDVNRMIEAGRDYQRIKLTPGESARTTDVTGYERGSIVRTEAGRVVVPPPAATNTPNLLAVDAAVVRGLGYRFGFPAYFTGESDASFASVLVTGSPFVRRITYRQHRAEAFNRKVAVRFVEFCERSGRFPRGTAQKVKPVTECEPVIIADEEKKSRVFLSEYQAGVASPQAYIRSRGDDPKQVEADIREWKAQNPPAGQQPPPGAGGAPGATDPTATPPGSAGGDGSSPNADPMAGLLGEGRIRENFTGTDSHGHHWVDGKQVAAPASAPPASAAHGPWRGKLPHPDTVTARPKSKKARAELGRALQNAWVEARNALAAKYGTRDINDHMSPEENAAESDLHKTLEPLASGNERDGPFDLGPVSDGRYAGYYRAALAALDQLRGHAAAKTEGRLPEDGQVTFPLTRENFTGTDSHGHHWVDGKQVSAPDEKPAAKASPAPSGPELEAAKIGKTLHSNVQIRHAQSGDWVVKGRNGKRAAVQNESAVSALAQGLGLDVPQVHHVTMYGQDQAVVAVVKGTDLTRLSPEDRKTALAKVPKDEVDKHALFDYLIGSADPNNGNYMIGTGGELIALDKEQSLRLGGIGDKASGRVPFFLADLSPSGHQSDYVYDPKHVAEMAAAGAEMAAKLKSAGKGADAKGVERRAAVLKQLAATGKPVTAGEVIAAGEAYDKTAPVPSGVLGFVRKLFGG